MKVAVFICLLTCSMVAFSQEKFSDRVFYGGGLALSAGSDFTNIGLSPFVGYRITQRLLAGFGINYQYVKFQGFDSAIDNYGWSVFGRYNLTRQFFIYTEFEQLNFEFITGVNEQTARDIYNAYFVGAGYSQALGGRAAFSVTALYNVLYDASDNPQPYGSPIVIRAGVGVGIL